MRGPHLLESLDLRVVASCLQDLAEDVQNLIQSCHRRVVIPKCERPSDGTRVYVVTCTRVRMPRTTLHAPGVIARRAAAIAIPSRIVA